jgi:dolichol-phosphate mannosyltransferase
MIGTPVRDCTSGFRCYRASALAAAHVEKTTSTGYFFCIEALSRVIDAGGSVEEVPITYVDRRLGQSKISNGIVFEAFWLTTMLGLGRLGGRRKAPTAAGS